MTNPLQAAFADIIAQQTAEPAIDPRAQHFVLTSYSEADPVCRLYRETVDPDLDEPDAGFRYEIDHESLVCLQAAPTGATLYAFFSGNDERGIMVHESPEAVIEEFLRFLENAKDHNGKWTVIFKTEIEAAVAAYRADPTSCQTVGYEDENDYLAICSVTVGDKYPQTTP